MSHELFVNARIADYGLLSFDSFHSLFYFLLSHWKRRFSTVLQKENALFILNSSSHVLFATNRFEPNCEPNLGEVLNLESILISMTFSIRRAFTARKICD